VILIDTSAWVELPHDTGSPISQRVDDLPAVEIATRDVVRMEVFAGARNEQHLQQLRRVLARASTLRTESVGYDAAAALYRTCCQRGHTVRKLIDCSIAAVTIRGDVPVLHMCVDFDRQAQYTTLKIDEV
jgi:predicted nucleic acid-binding protein